LTKLFAIFGIGNAVLRLILLAWMKNEVHFSFLILIKIFAVGIFFDLVAFSYIVSPAIIYYLLISQKIFNHKIHQTSNRALYYCLLYVIIFSFFAEITFWEEFQTRFNFIAVDYLIYTTEVIANIVESYPIGWLIASIAIITTMIFYFTHKKIVVLKEKNAAPSNSHYKKFLLSNLVALALPVIAIVSFFTIDAKKITTISENNYVSEIAANGVYQLFSAYRNNEIDFNKLYLTTEQSQSIQGLRDIIKRQEPDSKFFNDSDISRAIPAFKSDGEKKYNIILVTIESFSADFMGYFGNQENITPNLDKIAKKGLFFTGMKATGTRTIRGLEAITLSIPPTPGSSIVRRPNNEDLFNIASPLNQRGYDTKFLYGGFGYFDNMNYFFENNGFKIVDRAKFSKDEISFSNAWGVADEDLFNKTIKEADDSFAQKKPFFSFLMTTSNHRPFTYPSGRIDIESKSNRGGAVKYTDYAIGKFLSDASKKKWFDNTIFIFVADHCAGSAGNTDVPLWRYQIPAIFYAPKIIAPKIFEKNVSQIDIAPTLMGLLNLSYKSKFFGNDVLNNEKTIDNRAFVGTYTDVGYFIDDQLFLLKPKKIHRVFNVKIENYGWNGSSETPTAIYDQKKLSEAVNYYQSASYLFENQKLKNKN
jgi:phosphoglycerol transferase MdoB-like AlkP superfamily enzyme